MPSRRAGITKEKESCSMPQGRSVPLGRRRKAKYSARAKKNKTVEVKTEKKSGTRKNRLNARKEEGIIF